MRAGALSSLILFFYFLTSPLVACSQRLSAADFEGIQDWPRAKAIESFYGLGKDSFVWVRNEPLQKELLSLLKESSSLGLRESDYQFAFLRIYEAQGLSQSRKDSAEAELRITDAAIHFFTEAEYGNQPPNLSYTGWSQTAEPSLLPGKLKNAAENHSLRKLLDEIQPKSREFKAAREGLGRLLAMVKDGKFHEEAITSMAVDSSNTPLLKRLYQLGCIEADGPNLSVAKMVNAVKKAQVMFDLPDDGVLRNGTRLAINLSLHQRLEELTLLLNVLRWLEGMKQRSAFLVLNIPSANLWVYDRSELVVTSKVIVGKPTTPTPTLSSLITEVVLYPYWTVPKKIASRELLPLIKKNPDFLKLGNYQVINTQGKVLNPNAINWNKLSSRYFPYIIRQSTGCDNALGIVKFNFSNPYSVYLHDTPFKFLFSSTRRYYSHGCMRVEKPDSLAHFLLGSNRIAIDTLTAKGCVNQQSPVVVPAERRIPIIVLYSTAWYDTEGMIRFYPDVYKRWRNSGYQLTAVPVLE